MSFNTNYIFFIGYGGKAVSSNEGSKLLATAHGSGEL